MAKVKSPSDLGNLKTFEELRQYITIFLTDLISQINGNLEFAQNIKTQEVVVTFSAANTNTAIPHSLGRVPAGYIQVEAGAATSLYNGNVANTAGVFNLRSSAATTVRILLF